MFSKIGEYNPPAPVKKDGMLAEPVHSVRRVGDGAHQEKGRDDLPQHRKPGDETSSDFGEDTMVLSLATLRQMIEGDASIPPEVRREGVEIIAFLTSNGVDRIPLLAGEDLPSALLRATALVKGSGPGGGS